MANLGQSRHVGMFGVTNAHRGVNCRRSLQGTSSHSRALFLVLLADWQLPRGPRSHARAWQFLAIVNCGHENYNLPKSFAFKITLTLQGNSRNSRYIEPQLARKHPQRLAFPRFIWMSRYKAGSLLLCHGSYIDPKKGHRYRF